MQEKKETEKERKAGNLRETTRKTEESKKET